MTMNPKTAQRQAEVLSELRAKHQKKQAQQEKWDAQRKAADEMPPLELLEKARERKQLNPFEARRLYSLHAELAQKHAAEREAKERIVIRIKTLEKEMRDQQFFTNKLYNAATTHDDELGCAVSSVVWGRAANLLKSLIS